jgi:pyruvoyl-dependent arginine decarboxylase (PvlArgDC)
MEVCVMVYDDKVRYTMRIDRNLLDKFGYIAEYEGRTKNRELEQMIKRRIAEFEKEVGKIELYQE